MARLGPCMHAWWEQYVVEAGAPGMAWGVRTVAVGRVFPAAVEVANRCHGPWARCPAGRDGGEGGRGRESSSSRPRSSGQPSTFWFGYRCTFGPLNLVRSVARPVAGSGHGPHPRPAARWWSGPWPAWPGTVRSFCSICCDSVLFLFDITCVCFALNNEIVCCLFHML